MATPPAQLEIFFRVDLFFGQQHFFLPPSSAAESLAFSISLEYGGNDVREFCARINLSGVALT